MVSSCHTADSIFLIKEGITGSFVFERNVVMKDSPIVDPEQPNERPESDRHARFRSRVASTQPRR